MRKTLGERAEQALLGAMIGDREFATRMDWFGECFGSARHRKIYNAIITAALDFTDAEESWPDLIRMTSGPKNAGYAAELKTACPNPVHGDSYAALVAEAHRYRGLRETENILSERVGRLDADGERISRARAGAGAGAGGDQDWLTRDDIGWIPEDMARLAGQMRGSVGQCDVGATYAAAGPPALAADPLACDEELVLGGILARHPGAGQACEVLEPRDFADELRSDLFRAISWLRVDGMAVDSLTADWQRNRLRLRAGLPFPDPEMSAGDSPGYATRLAESAQVPGQPITTAAARVWERSPYRRRETGQVPVGRLSAGRPARRVPAQSAQARQVMDPPSAPPVQDRGPVLRPGN